MPKISLIAEFECKPGRVRDFIERTIVHAGIVRKEEPGCVQFHIMQPAEGGNTVVLYEVYADQAAIEAHRVTPHLQEYRRDFAPMVETLTRRDLTLIDE